MFAVSVVLVISGTSVIDAGHRAVPCFVTEKALLSTSPYAPVVSPNRFHCTLQLQSPEALVHAPARAVKVKSAEPEVNDCCCVTSKCVAPSQPVIVADTASPSGGIAGKGVVCVTVHVKVPNCGIGVSVSGHDTETDADAVTAMLQGTGSEL